MVGSNSKEAWETESWSLVLTGNSGSSRHPSSRQKAVEVCANFLRVKKANYETLSNADGNLLILQHDIGNNINNFYYN
jgi:hypothetical protein